MKSQGNAQTYQHSAHPAKCCKKNGPESAANTSPGPDQPQPDKEDRGMAADGQYRDSTPPDNVNKDGTWQSIGGLAASLVAKAAKKVEGGECK